MRVVSNSPRSGHPARLLVAYAVMLLVAGGLLLALLAYGASLETVVAAPAAAGAAKKSSHVLAQVLLALIAVIAVGRLLGFLLVRVGQPPVIGEVLAGILLGPSLLGVEWSAWLLPSSVAPYLGVLAQLGVILFMFVIGLELNPDHLSSRAHSTVAISHASIVAPFLLGAVLSLWLYPRLAPPGVGFHSFALFLGVSMSVTAFPVLARILSDQGLLRTDLATVALACAAADDLTAWCLLAVVVGIVNASLSGAVVTLGLACLFVAGMLLVVRPLLRRLLQRPATADAPVEAPSPSLVTGLLLAALLSALLTEMIGIHAIFGAFLLGAIIPHDAPINPYVRERLGPLAAMLLLPAFFAYTGMRTQIGLVSGLEAWLTVALIIAVATLGKFGGTYLAARWTQLDHRTSASLGILMNTRGLMELIVLNIGLDLGVISPKLFAMLVIMALVTTVATTPILRRLYPSAAFSPS